MSIDPRNSKSDAPTSQRTSVSKAASQSTTPSSNQPDNTQKAVSSDKSNATTLESINVKVGQAIKAKVSEVLNVVSTRSGQSNFKVTLDIGGQKLSVKTKYT